MIIVTCIPPAGYEVYRCGWRDEVRDGKHVRVGFCWNAGTTELADDALTEEQIKMLENDPGERIKVRRIPGVEPTKKGNSAKKAKGASKETKEPAAAEGEDP